MNHTVITLDSCENTALRLDTLTMKKVGLFRALSVSPFAIHTQFSDVSPLLPSLGLISVETSFGNTEKMVQSAPTRAILNTASSFYF